MVGHWESYKILVVFGPYFRVIIKGKEENRSISNEQSLGLGLYYVMAGVMRDLYKEYDLGDV